MLNCPSFIAGDGYASRVPESGPPVSKGYRSGFLPSRRGWKSLLLWVGLGYLCLYLVLYLLFKFPRKPTQRPERLSKMYIDDLEAWCEDLALERPDGISLVLDDMNPALAGVADMIQAEVPKTPANNPLCPQVGTYFSFEQLKFLQICILGAMLNALADNWKVNGHAIVSCTPPTPTTPFTVLEIEIPVIPGRQRAARNHPSNPDFGLEPDFEDTSIMPELPGTNDRRGMKDYN